MKLLNLLLAIMLPLVLINVQEAKAEEFIVFVHGLAGFGRDEMLGLGYWGFPKLTGNNFTDWMQKQTGLKTFEASVGPFSSNWDRACELYAQILGRKTDFGKAHSTAQSHLRMGRDFTKDSTKYNYYRQGGFFPTWGSANKVHFIGHSMGGQTIRFLERLLHQGDAAETALKSSGGYNGDANGPMSDLFQTGNDRNWIASVTTIASPLDGSTLHTKLDATGAPITSYLKDILLIIGAASSTATWFSGESSGPYLYDFDLDQHTDFKKPSSAKTYDAFKAWADQIFSSPKWSTNYKDLADYDMSPHKMKEFNAAGPRVYSNTRYFAMSTYQTKTCALNWNDQCADLDINPIMSVTANIIGNLDDLLGNNDVCDKWGDCYGDPWEQNDGLVPRISSTGPTFGVPTSGANAAGAPIAHPKTTLGAYKYSKTDLKKGQWYTIPVQRDHAQVIGLSALWTPWFMYEHIRNIINAIKNDV